VNPVEEVQAQAALACRIFNWRFCAQATFGRIRGVVRKWNGDCFEFFPQISPNRAHYIEHLSLLSKLNKLKSPLLFPIFHPWHCQLPVPSFDPEGPSVLH
jgi:hypothetical protein